MIYLDYNATTPLDNEVIENIKSALKVWGNPSSKYSEGRKAKALIDKARGQVAGCINCCHDDVVFTSGGSEANNWVVHSCVKKHPGVKPRVVTTCVEHDSVIKPLKCMEAEGVISLSEVGISTETGEVCLDSLEKAITKDTCLVTIMWANNETGTLMPLEKIVEIVRQKEKVFERKIFIHTDAAQVIGKINVDVKEIQVDFLTIAGHKFYGPKIGALYVRNLQSSNAISPMIHGGGQERGWRSGTENVPMVTGLGHACALVTENLADYAENMRTTRDYLKEKLVERFGKDVVRFNCKSENCLPNTCNVSIMIKGCEGYKVLENVTNFNCSTGSACHSDNCRQPSKILLRFGVSPDQAMHALRFSTGRSTSLSQIDVVVDELARVVSLLSSEISYDSYY